MKDFKYIWVVGLLVTAMLVIVPIASFAKGDTETSTDPWAFLPTHPTHTDHSSLFDEPLNSGPEVTAACLECHEDAAHQVIQTSHWTWESEPVLLPGRTEPVTTGKKNSINNFCIGIQSNWPGCTSCHAGYGWQDANFDFSSETNVDCLVCHDTSGTYIKSKAGLPAESVDLLAAAQSVGLPTRDNCGGCHFNGGGGDAVKHGDLDSSLLNPPDSVDIHMGKYDFVCTDCHRTTDHNIAGRSISVSTDDTNQVYCTDCHKGTIHQDERINGHLDSVACQTCHIPEGAVREATKMHWDWSTAGQDLPEDPHVYLKIKGSFVYEENFMPQYAWFNGTADRYILGDPIDPTTPTALNQPLGEINDPNAKIWPFKVHEADQPYDSAYNYLLQPKTVGEGGFWTDFNWDQALRLGSQVVNMTYSGSYGFAPTEMYWPLSHMVVPGEDALQCNDCHGENGRMDWEALGYFGDPMRWGGRSEAVGSTDTP
ncbi:MAG: tetrathionate reductase family octaheme c-type cytochrome [Anaerolineales bacterium]|nr:tetrathionate reductase family octaheme c-type cytochrome [Anaerolineales bacterium]MCB8954838.1 tetrathionate reductase family octaheme c-type cytochrome [Ardenticatenales bacterium]